MSEYIEAPTGTRSNQSGSCTIGIIIAILLLLILLVQVYTIIDTRQQRQVEEQRAAEIRDKAANIAVLYALQDELTSDLFASYQEDAYDNPSVERITEQQLIATEYQLLSLQILSRQNQAIVDLLSLQYSLPQPAEADTPQAPE